MTKHLVFSLALGLGLMAGIGGAQAEGDPAAGEKVFRACKACHTLEEGKNRVGPHLANIINRPAGAVDGFRYSKNMLELAEQGLVWNEETLRKYLANPKDVVPKGSMSFAGIRKEQDLTNLIAYLRAEAGVTQ